MRQQRITEGRSRQLTRLACGTCLLGSIFIAGSMEQLPGKCAPAAKWVHQLQPDHPAGMVHLMGRVLLEVRLERNGTVGAAQVVSSTLEPRAYALHSVRGFIPDRFEQDLLATHRAVALRISPASVYAALGDPIRVRGRLIAAAASGAQRWLRR